MVKLICQISLILVFLISLFSCKKSSENGNMSGTRVSENDSLYTSMVINHLRKNFDDIHDVSMRFHHMDHNLNGLIVFHLNWENGKIQSAEVLKNETENENLSSAFVEKMRTLEY